MTTKRLKHSQLEFFATSPRLVKAYQHAVLRSKKLPVNKSIDKLERAMTSGRSARPADEYQFVVLSHADDDYIVPTASHLRERISKAFHFLFTGPDTHPDQVARWIRSTKIRSEKRLHVVKVTDLEAPQVSELLGRVQSAFAPEGGKESIIDAYLSGHEFLVLGPKHRMLHVPISSIPALNGQPETAIQNFEIDSDGSFIYWPDLDVHLGWNQFRQAVEPAELQRAQQRSADFNRRYGAAIRKVREAAGIPQSHVGGLTDRQVRRIEQGICRATASALSSLAKAHGIDINAYMAKLANEMSKSS